MKNHVPVGCWSDVSDGQMGRFNIKAAEKSSFGDFSVFFHRVPRETA